LREPRKIERVIVPARYEMDPAVLAHATGEITVWLRPPGTQRELATVRAGEYLVWATRREEAADRPCLSIVKGKRGKESVTGERFARRIRTRHAHEFLGLFAEDAFAGLVGLDHIICVRAENERALFHPLECKTLAPTNGREWADLVGPGASAIAGDAERQMVVEEFVISLFVKSTQRPERTVRQFHQSNMNARNCSPGAPRPEILAPHVLSDALPRLSIIPALRDVAQVGSPGYDRPAYGSWPRLAAWKYRTARARTRSSHCPSSTARRNPASLCCH